MLNFGSRANDETRTSRHPFRFPFTSLTPFPYMFTAAFYPASFSFLICENTFLNLTGKSFFEVLLLHIIEYLVKY